jgi:hypothetical protein
LATGVIHSAIVAVMVILLSWLGSRPITAPVVYAAPRAEEVG